MTKNQMTFLRGTLDLLILRSLTWGQLHGYAITEWLEKVTDGTFLLEEGTLYPALHRLERKGFIQAEWGLSENNRRARFYCLTKKGTKQLETETRDWARYAAAMAQTLSPEVSAPGSNR